MSEFLETHCCSNREPVQPSFPEAYSFGPGYQKLSSTKMFAFPKSSLPLTKQALASQGIWDTLILGVPCFRTLWLRGVGTFVRTLRHPLPSPSSSELVQPWECGPSTACEGPALDMCLIYVIPEMPHSRWVRPPGLHLRFTVLQGVENYKRGLLEQDRGAHGFAFFLLSLCQITSTICPSLSS